MKRVLLLLIAVFVTAAAQASLRHAEYRWRNDDGDEVTATWRAASNTPITITSMDEVLRLRVEFDNINDNGYFSTIDHFLYYSKDGGATWDIIDESDVNDFKLVSSSFVAHGTNTTNLLDDGLGVFVSGKVISADAPDMSVDLFDGERTEIEWVFKPTENCENFTTYQFMMIFWEMSGEVPTATTNFGCDAPVVTVESDIYERCGPGSFVVSAYADIDGADISWWTSAVGGTLLGSGNDFETPEYASSTTIYADAQYLGCPAVERVPVQLIVHDMPEIEIPLADGEYCATPTQFEVNTSPDQPDGTTFSWSTGDNTSSIFVDALPGETQTIWVQVANEYGCSATDTAHLIINPSPIVNLGEDRVICEDFSTILDAGIADAVYYWSNGETSQQIEVNVAGSYSVVVTNEYGCVGRDTIDITVSGTPPTVDGISVTNVTGSIFNFLPIHPSNVEIFRWDFGDGSDPVEEESPNHEFATAGSYTVTLTTINSCGENEYTTYVTVVSGLQDHFTQHQVKVFPILPQIWCQ